MIEEGNFTSGEERTFRDEITRHAEKLRTFDGQVVHEVPLLAAYAHKLYADGMYDISMAGSEQLRRDEAFAATGRVESNNRQIAAKEQTAGAVGKYILGNVLWTAHEALHTGTFNGNAFRERHNYGIASTHLDHLQIDPKLLSIANIQLYPWQRHDLEGLAEADPTLALTIDEEVFPDGFKKWMETTVVTAYEVEEGEEKVTVIKTVSDVVRMQLPEYKRQARLLTSHGAVVHTLDEMRMRTMVDDDVHVEKSVSPKVSEVEIFGPAEKAALAAYLQQESS